MDLNNPRDLFAMCYASARMGIRDTAYHPRLTLYMNAAVRCLNNRDKPVTVDFSVRTWSDGIRDNIKINLTGQRQLPLF